MTVVFDALRGKRVGCFLGEPTCRRPGPPRPASPRRAPPRFEPPVVCPGFGFDKLQKQTDVGPLSGHRPGNKLLVNSSSCSLIRFTYDLVRASEDASRMVVLGILEVESERSCPRHTALLRPALPRPARGVSGFWIRQVMKKSYVG